MMALSARLQLRQSQSLVMTPQLMQSIKLLQLSNIELQEFIAAEIEKNPLLELGNSESQSAHELSASADDERSADLDSGQVTTEGMETDTMMRDAPSLVSEGAGASLDGGQENLYESEPVRAEGQPDQPQADMKMQGGDMTSGSNASMDDYNLEAFVGSSVTLYEFLREQAAVEFTDPVERLLAEEIIGCLDEDGYLRTELQELAELMGTTHERMNNVLMRVQLFEPAGVAARSLPECLAVQLFDLNRFDPAMETMIANLDLLARRDYAQLQKLCGVDHDDLIDMVKEIRALDPRPGLRFEGGLSEPVIPDVMVTEASDGGWAIELNADTLPKVLVNRTYYAEVSGHLKSDGEKEFMVDCLQTANWLVKSMDQRAQTILKVAGEIVKQQDMFLAHGVEHLKPLNLKTVADAIKMHESTVSRVTSNKYMMTPRGLFELKYFFTTGLASSDGQADHSSESVRHHIRQLIEAESATSVLSDDAIVEKLKAKDIEIARRTVAKYREAMNIPSSVQRRREKKGALLEQV